MTIISKERIKREYAHIAQHEPPDQAAQWTAEKLGIPVATVKQTIQDQEQPA
ncbi:hypothetical protein ACO0LC_14460 [Undibacterium sp. JH2W]|uniref:hypothetical protein n=1 Tax=Undibacterium sp. JH2W TaxID=3413037 RepID=UPI003BF06826